MKNKLIRLLAAALCVAAFSVTAFASDGGYYASDEKGDEQPPDSIDTIVVGTENVTMPENQGGTALTPEGNLTLIDDILQSNAYVSEETKLEDKQFITVQSKNGNYFYLVIDRSGDTENVYFLNLVDEADLMALLEDGETETTIPVCSCKDKCAVGAIKTDCEICRINMSECVGKEPVVEPDPTPNVEQPPAQTTPTNQSNPGVMFAILIIAGGGAFAVYWFKFKDSKPKTSGDSDLDDYEFGQDEDEEPEETEIDDADVENEDSVEDEQ